MAIGCLKKMELEKKVVTFLFPGTFVCDCHLGFRSQSGGGTCEDINECLDFDCGQHGRCVNLVGTFECQCEVGFQMAASNKTCIDINECKMDNPCLNGECINKDGGYDCDCYQGYLLKGNQLQSWAILKAKMPLEPIFLTILFQVEFVLMPMNARLKLILVDWENASTLMEAMSVCVLLATFSAKESVKM